MHNKQDLKILVIGDECIDRFVYGTCERLSPEAPTPVLIPTHTIGNAGMAGNVAKNLEALGYEPTLISNMNGLFTANSEGDSFEKTTVIKTRYVDEDYNYILLRTDENDKVNESLTIDLLEEIVECNNYGQGLSDVDLVLVADYNKGFLTEEIMSYIFENAKYSFLDTKRRIGHWAKNVTYIKINNKEYRSFDNKQFLTTHRLLNKVIVTEGGGGCRIGTEWVNTRRVDVKDVTGAGDTFMAAGATKFLETNNIWEAMKFANECARTVVQQRGVVTL